MSVSQCSSQLITYHDPPNIGILNFENLTHKPHYALQMPLLEPHTHSRVLQTASAELPQHYSAGEGQPCDTLYSSTACISITICYNANVPQHSFQHCDYYLCKFESSV